MADEKNSEGKKTISYTFVPFRPFPDFDGKRTVDGPRSKVKSPGFFKPELALPIPGNDDEAQAMYGQTVEQLLMKGVRQHYYDVDQVVIAWFNERITEDNDVDSIAETGEVPPNDLFIKVPTERKASEARKAKELQAKHGMTLDDIDAMLSDPAAAMARLKELEAQAKGGKGKKK